MNKEEYIRRRHDLADEFYENSILIFSGEVKYRSLDSEYPFCVDKNFFYLTGLNEPDLVLYLKKEGPNDYVEILYQEQVSSRLKLFVAPKFTSEQIKTISGISKIFPLKDFGNLVTKLLVNPSNTFLDIDKENTTIISPSPAQYFFKNFSFEDNPLRDYFKKVRSQKSDNEILKIREAIHRTKLGLNNVMKMISVHNFDEEITYEDELLGSFIQGSCYQGSTLSFQPIFASGENGTILHYSSNNQRVKNNELILLDVGNEYEGYSSDISRTYPLSGRFSTRFAQIYQACLNVNKGVIKFIKPFVTLKDIDDFAMHLMSEELLKLGLIKSKKETRLYFYHSVTHHLGLDDHDLADYSAPLLVGAVVTVEPGIYIKDEKIGVRIEDDILVTPTGNENLSADLPKEICDLERIFSECQSKKTF